MRIVSVVAGLFVASTLAFTQGAEWRVDLAKPALVIGADVDDTTQLFAQVVGATRLPKGSILVGDYAAFSLHLFDAAGKRIKTFGRKGEGPGEFGYLARFFRCGDTVVTYDIANGNRVSVFALDGKFVRMFRFDSPETGRAPYSAGTSCNRRMLFSQYGWGIGSSDSRRAPETGVFRRPVPFWIGGPDGAIRVVLDSLPGSERYAHMSEGRVVGSGPLPFGKQPRMAIGTDRVYVGIGDRYEVLVFDLAGKPLPPIAKPIAAPVPLTQADIDAEKEKQLAATRPDRQAQLERDFPLIPFPKTLPPYDRLVVDADDNLWVQDYPRMRSPTVRWTVFAKGGAQLATVTLPRDLEVFEIGRDYVLGRYLDADEGIPHVRMYRLTR